MRKCRCSTAKHKCRGRGCSAAPLRRQTGKPPRAAPGAIFTAARCCRRATLNALDGQIDRWPQHDLALIRKNELVPADALAAVFGRPAHDSHLVARLQFHRLQRMIHLRRARRGYGFHRPRLDRTFGIARFDHDAAVRIFNRENLHRAAQREQLGAVVIEFVGVMRLRNGRRSQRSKHGKPDQRRAPALRHRSTWLAAQRARNTTGQDICPAPAACRPTCSPSRHGSPARS